MGTQIVQTEQRSARLQREQSCAARPGTSLHRQCYFPVFLARCVSPALLPPLAVAKAHCLMGAADSAPPSSPSITMAGVKIPLGFSPVLWNVARRAVEHYGTGMRERGHAVSAQPRSDGVVRDLSIRRPVVGPRRRPGGFEVHMVAKMRSIVQREQKARSRSGGSGKNGFGIVLARSAVFLAQNLAQGATLPGLIVC